MTETQDTKKAYDLEERTAVFGENIISFSKKVPKDIVSNPLISQMIRSGTSVGANYCEADDAESKKDFKHKLSICKKEARETKHWLRLICLNTKDSALQDEGRKLWQEAKELNLIFNAIVHKLNQTKK